MDYAVAGVPGSSFVVGPTCDLTVSIASLVREATEPAVCVGFGLGGRKARPVIVDMSQVQQRNRVSAKC